MAEHYYSENPTVQHDRGWAELTARGITLKFITDAGVFSKRKIDEGSKLMIDTMQIPETAKVLDVGCGYGPIGLFAACMATRGTVDMVDINLRAVNLARENATLNRITNVNVRQQDVMREFPNLLYTRILTNPPIRAGKQTVFSIFDESYERLEAEGELWVVIQKKQGAPSAFTKLQQRFATVEEVTKHKGYRIFRAIKR